METFNSFSELSDRSMEQIFLSEKHFPSLVEPSLEMGKAQLLLCFLSVGLMKKKQRGYLVENFSSVSQSESRRNKRKISIINVMLDLNLFKTKKKFSTRSKKVWIRWSFRARLLLSRKEGPKSKKQLSILKVCSCSDLLKISDEKILVSWCKKVM